MGFDLKEVSHPDLFREQNGYDSFFPVPSSVEIPPYNNILGIRRKYYIPRINTINRTNLKALPGIEPADTSSTDRQTFKCFNDRYQRVNEVVHWMFGGNANLFRRAFHGLFTEEKRSKKLNDEKCVEATDCNLISEPLNNTDNNLSTKQNQENVFREDKEKQDSLSVLKPFADGVDSMKETSNTSTDLCNKVNIGTAKNEKKRDKQTPKDTVVNDDDQTVMEPGMNDVIESKEEARKPSPTAATTKAEDWTEVLRGFSSSILKKGKSLPQQTEEVEDHQSSSNENDQKAIGKYLPLKINSTLNCGSENTLGNVANMMARGVLLSLTDDDSESFEGITEVEMPIVEDLANFSGEFSTDEEYKDPCDIKKEISERFSPIDTNPKCLQNSYDNSFKILPLETCASSSAEDVSKAQDINVNFSQFSKSLSSALNDDKNFDTLNQRSTTHLTEELSGKRGNTGVHTSTHNFEQEDFNNSFGNSKRNCKAEKIDQISEIASDSCEKSLILKDNPTDIQHVCNKEETFSLDELISSVIILKGVEAQQRGSSGEIVCAGDSQGNYDTYCGLNFCSSQSDGDIIKRSLSNPDHRSQKSTVSFLKDYFLDGKCSPEEILKHIQAGLHQRDMFRSAVKLNLVRQEVLRRTKCILKDLANLSEKQLDSLNNDDGFSIETDSEIVSLSQLLSTNCLETQESTSRHEDFTEKQHPHVKVTDETQIYQKYCEDTLSSTDSKVLELTNAAVISLTENKAPTISSQIDGAHEKYNAKTLSRGEEAFQAILKFNKARQKAELAKRMIERKETIILDKSVMDKYKIDRVKNFTEHTMEKHKDEKKLLTISDEKKDKKKKRSIKSPPCVTEPTQPDICASHRSVKSVHDTLLLFNSLNLPASQTADHTTVSASSSSSSVAKANENFVNEQASGESLATECECKVIEKLNKQESLITEIERSNDALYYKCATLEAQRQELQLKLNRMQQKIISVESENVGQLDKMIRTQSELKAEITTRKCLEKELERLKQKLKADDEARNNKQITTSDKRGRATYPARSGKDKEKEEKVKEKEDKVKEKEKKVKEREEKVKERDKERESCKISSKPNRHQQNQGDTDATLLKVKKEINQLRAQITQLEMDKSAVEKEKEQLKEAFLTARNNAQQLENTVLSTQKDLKRMTTLQEHFMAECQYQKEYKLLNNCKAVQTDMISCHIEVAFDKKLRRIHQKEILRLRQKVKTLEDALVGAKLIKKSEDNIYCSCYCKTLAERARQEYKPRSLRVIP